MSTRWTAAQVEENNRRRREPAAKKKAEGIPISAETTAAWALYRQAETALWDAYERQEAVLWAEAELVCGRGEG